MIKYIVTTRKEILENLRQEGYYIIGVDGTVPDAVELYDELYDHHRTGGAEIQILELDDFQKPEADKIAIITTMLDADAVCSAYYVTKKICGVEPQNKRWLEAVSYDCDHLGVPEKYSDLADDAAMCVAAMKETSNQLISELGLNPDRRSWSIENKEKYASTGFQLGVANLDNPDWNYREIAKPYWQKVRKNTQMIIDQKRITAINFGFLFNQQGIKDYIDPRCWIKATQQMGIDSPDRFLTLTAREVFIKNEYKGLSYTLGSVPLHPKLESWDYTQGVFQALTEAEREIDPNADGWGGRKTVGGSGWNTTSNLSPEEVFDIVQRFV